VVPFGLFAGDGGDVAAAGIWVAVARCGVGREDLPVVAQAHEVQQVAARVAVVARSGGAARSWSPMVCTVRPIASATARPVQPASRYAAINRLVARRAVPFCPPPAATFAAPFPTQPECRQSASRARVRR